MCTQACCVITKRLPPIPTQKDYKENEAPFKVSSSCSIFQKTGVGFLKLGLVFFSFFWGHRPGGHMLNHFRLPCPADCCIPLRDRRSHRSCCVNVCTLQSLALSLSLSLSLSVHSTTCHEIGVVGGHKKPEESN
jgi:hypothetical protein